MSRQTEEEFDKYFQAHLDECQRDLVVGATVYRPNYGDIQEGVIVVVSRCVLRSDGTPVETVNGDKALYYASFGREWVSQTHQWKFFAKRPQAVAALLEEMRRESRDLTARQEKLNKRIAELSAEADFTGMRF